MSRKPYFIFHAGQRVQAADKLPPFLEGTGWVVKSVRDFRECCDCGGFLGGHLAGCISRMWSLESGHHQQVTVTATDGKDHGYSGAWFRPVIESCRWTDQEHERFLAALEALVPSKRVNYSLRFDRFPLEIIVTVGGPDEQIFTDETMMTLSRLAAELSGYSEPLLLLNYKPNAVTSQRLVAAGLLS